MNTFILGAGASKAFSESPTGLRMPLATEIFKTFDQLPAAENPWVLTGNILNYARDVKGVPIDQVFERNYDVEEFHSEVEAALLSAIEQHSDEPSLHPEVLILQNTYNQLISVFCCVLNDISNGPPSSAHQHFVSQLADDDVLVTFNWDTLLDRVLNESGKWNCETGYGFSPVEIFRDGWVKPLGQVPSRVKLIKLHGSTNWLTSYQIINPNTGQTRLIQVSAPDVVRVFEYSTKPYDTYAGRYMGPYSPFTMGYYPPNFINEEGMPAKEGHVFVMARARHPMMPEGTAGDKGLLSQALIIPPVRQKKYDFFGSIFFKLWKDAEDAIASSDNIYLIGYSFPKTDLAARDLFRKAFCRRTTFPKIIIVNPAPESLFELFTRDMGIPANYVQVRKEYFDSSFALS